MDLKMASLLVKYLPKGILVMVVACFLTISLAGRPYILAGYSENSGSDQNYSQAYGKTAAYQNPESGKTTIKSLQPARAESHTQIGRDLMGRRGGNLWAGKSKQFNKQVSIQRSVPMMDNIKECRLLGAQKFKPYAVNPTQSIEPNRPMPYKGPPTHYNVVDPTQSVEPSRPMPYKGPLKHHDAVDPAQFVEPNRPMAYKGPPAHHNAIDPAQYVKPNRPMPYKGPPTHHNAVDPTQFVEPNRPMAYKGPPAHHNAIDPTQYVKPNRPMPYKGPHN